MTINNDEEELIQLFAESEVRRRTMKAKTVTYTFKTLDDASYFIATCMAKHQIDFRNTKMEITSPTDFIVHVFHFEDDGKKISRLAKKFAGSLKVEP